MKLLFILCLGERLSEDEIDQLFQGMEDAQGNINYEGKRDVPCVYFCAMMY